MQHWTCFAAFGWCSIVSRLMQRLVRQNYCIGCCQQLLECQKYLQIQVHRRWAYGLRISRFCISKECSKLFVRVVGRTIMTHWFLMTSYPHGPSPYFKKGDELILENTHTRSIRLHHFSATWHSIMGLVHTPRVIWSAAKGWLRKSSVGKEVGYTVPHKYYARAGLFDVDYMGHMNNAAFLSHAELARWEMTGSNGLIPAMMKHNTHFVVQSTTARYRAEVRPIFRKFQVDTTVCAVDDKNIWL